MPTETMTLTPEQVLKDYDDYKLSLCGSSRATATRISDIGHPCTAYLAFTRIAGETRDLPGVDLACTFDEGRAQERKVMMDLQAMGYDCIQSQRAVYWEKFELVGHPDTKISKNGSRPMPTEIKSCSPFIWAKVQAERDIREHKYWFVQKWAAQLQCYLLLENEPEGWFILKNKVTGRLKIIPVQLDFEYAETLLKKADRVLEGIDRYRFAKPDWEPWLKSHRLNDPEMCLECPFRSICLPEIDAGQGAQMFNDPEMVEALDRRAELQAAAKEFEEVDGEIKEKAKKAFDSGSTQLVCGNWMVSGKQTARTVYNVPKDVKEKYADKASSWRTTISKIG